MKQKWKRPLALLLSVAMMFSMSGTPVYAADMETGASAVCPHHVHDETCGYSEGTPCTHEHTDDCYTLVTQCIHEHTAECYSDGMLPAEGEEKAADACTHVCSEESGCITKELNCPHVHDETCGYSEGSPCTFDPSDCELCNFQENPAEQTILSWEWIGADNLNEGVLPLPDVSAENPVDLATVVSMLPTGITYAITLIFFGVLGVMQYHGGDADMSRVIEFSNALNAAEGGIFNINPVLLLPPVVVIVAVALKVPAIPGITLGIVAGVILGLIFQPGACTLGTIFDYGKNGYYFSEEALAMFEASLSPETSYTMTRLLESGGIMGMMSSVSMTIIAMMFGGIMEQTHQLEVIVNSLKKFAKGPAALVGLTEVTCVLSNATMPEQYISIVVPGRMYAEEYHKMGVHPAVLSSALEGAGTVTSALIPWNTCGVFIKDTLNIAPWGAGGYGPWAIFNWLMPIINWLCVLIGWTLKDLAGKPFKKSKKVAQ